MKTTTLRRYLIMTKLSDLTTDQKQTIVDGLQVMLDKVITPTAKYLAGNPHKYSRDAIKVVEINSEKYQIHPVIAGSNTDDFFTINITITKGSMIDDPVSTFSGKFTSYADVQLKIDDYKKEILA